MLASTNKKLFEDYGNDIWSLVMDRLNIWLDYSGNYEDLEAEDLVRLGFCDPVKLFVKDEPHSKEKVKDGRYRLISSVSIVDQIIERLLHSRLNGNCIEMWDECPSKCGLGLHDDGMILITESIKRLIALRGEVMATDVSGWDWSVQGWEIRDAMEVRIKLAQATEDSVFAHLCRINAMVVSSSVFVDPDGNCYAQTSPGIQLSGRYCTSSDNCFMRIVACLHARIMAGLEPLVDGKCGIDAMGDDSVEVAFEQILEQYEKIGHRIKGVTYNSSVEGVEFCSQVFAESGLAKPVQASKTVFRFLSRSKDTQEYPELWAQLSWYLRHLGGPEKEKIRKLAMARVDRVINRINGESKKPTTQASG